MMAQVIAKHRRQLNLIHKNADEERSTRHLSRKIYTERNWGLQDQSECECEGCIVSSLESLLASHTGTRRDALSPYSIALIVKVMRDIC